MFKYAIRWGVVDINPCLGVERFKEQPRDRYIEDWEYEAFKAHAGPFFAAYMDFKLLTGLRQGDVLSIKLSDIKDDGIYVILGKSTKPIIIEWTDSLKAAVKVVRALPKPNKISGMYLFTNKLGRPYTVDGFRSNWQRRMKSALEQGVIKERFTEHDIRAKSGSDTTLEHATNLLTHKDSKTTQKHYRRKTLIVKPLK